ncbi:hypothetical protein [uncultured Vagococcus sp.]|uniref:hypothetical protein n=1 Tax=uncultured Vagococcus sp. TaxID=189676 RepID=UPI0028D306F0|nr:hypothetical protein [uncultured Vagococcus sp.]
MQKVIEELSKAEGQIVTERETLEQELKVLELNGQQQLAATKEAYKRELEEAEKQAISRMEEQGKKLVESNQRYLKETFKAMEDQMNQKKPIIVEEIVKEVQDLYGHF